MNLYTWICSAVESVVGTKRHSRRTVWKRVGGGARDVQVLEQKCLLSGMSAAPSTESIPASTPLISAEVVPNILSKPGSSTNNLPDQLQQSDFDTWKRIRPIQFVTQFHNPADLHSGYSPIQNGSDSPAGPVGHDSGWGGIADGDAGNDFCGVDWNPNADCHTLDDGGADFAENEDGGGDFGVTDTGFDDGTDVGNEVMIIDVGNDTSGDADIPWPDG